MRYTTHGAKSLVNINAPKFRVDNDKEHVYIKLVVDSLFVCLIRYLDSARELTLVVRGY